MKKYKLIKWYPGCGKHKVNDIVTKSTCGSPLYLGNRLTDTLKAVFSAKDVENNPEFWEEIIEKDYEILSFINLDNNCTYHYFSKTKNFCIKHNIEFLDSYSRSLEFCLKYYKIHSVKRLSDGEIFTIGDKVQDSLTDYLTNFKIQEIVCFNKSNKLICTTKSGTTAPLSTIRHIKKPLFTTEDGVDIYKGDKFFTLSKNNINISSLFSVIATGHIKNNNYLDFSTKEAAEEYILMNKPCLSINDIVNLNNILIFRLDSIVLSNLKKLVKSKLNEK